MTIESGCRVLVMDDLRTEGGRLVSVGTTGTLLGYEGERYVVEVEERATGERLTLVTDRWNVRRLAPRLVR